ncbi:zinc-dependent alcohol dehydrogenase family protein [Serratia liquefaciens]|uniref:zinc-dependent alcohol dehydrogenase family protein n=1 Tax=Serratia liquefaciens TaxID=614 RepID=UPI00141C1D5A|nr:zinc-dependent alcohol dehydrogenase family protein [Serratia liquefaciens]MBF8103900.1 zinc-dependent alcohol dehydrogenase family protein [Serratia liquefaciens]CAB1211539.1 Quinone oxidoreductase 1 [Serratia liquefaciens]
MARVIQFDRVGEPDVLKIVDVDLPALAADEVSIKVKAIGLNRAEALLRRGKYAFPPVFPQRMGYEAAGIIDAVGAQVQGLIPGDAVSVIPSLAMDRWPTYGETIHYPARYVVKHPENLSWEQAASAWMQYITAYGALVDVAEVTSGDYVMVTAASSSVGIAAIQIANMLGARVIATSRTESKRQALLDIGASWVVTSQGEKSVAEVKEITGDRPPRVIFDCIGGEGVPTLCEILAPGGTLIEYGNLSGENTPFPASLAIPKGLTIRGFAYSEIVGNAARLAKAKTFILAALSRGELKPVIAKSFVFDQIVAAHQYLEANTQLGKIVVTV